MKQENLYAALRAAFPPDLDATAIETADTATPLFYTWRDLERGSAMIANLIDQLQLPPQTRVAVQVEKSVEALMLYLAVLRAGHVFLPLNTALRSSFSAKNASYLTPPCSQTSSTNCNCRRSRGWRCRWKRASKR